MKSDEQLAELIAALAERTYEEHLSGGLQRQEYLHVSGHPDAMVFQRDYREAPVAIGVEGNIRITSVEKYEEWKKLREYLNQEYDISASQPTLQNLLISIFGKYLEYLDEYSERINSISEDITADARSPTYDFKSSIFDLSLDSSLSFNDIELRPRVREDVEIDIHRIDELLPNGSVSVPSKSILKTSIIEHSVAGGENIEDQKHGQKKSRLTCGLLNLFADANYSVIRTEISGRYFRVGSVNYSQETRIAADNRFEVTHEDAHRLENLHSLFHPMIAEDLQGEIFEYPLSVAYHSLQRAWEYKHAFREAFGWLLIGLQSIVGSNGNVSGRVSLLVSSVSDRYDRESVEQDMADAFNKRSAWAHGASRKRDNPSDIQMQIRDYLRISMVAFGHLRGDGTVKSRKSLRDKLEDSLEDDRPSDEWLKSSAADLSLSNYLQLPAEER